MELGRIICSFDNGNGTETTIYLLQEKKLLEITTKDNKVIGIIWR